MIRRGTDGIASGRDTAEGAAAHATAPPLLGLSSAHGPNGFMASTGSLTQNWSAQESIFPVSYDALSLTRSFQVPLAASDDAFTV
ncbi:hypothetical protein RKD30_004564 [Streptomyces pristinaespiralis]|jgi:hypothetical protein